MFTLTFTQVFEANGTKNGKPWKRWDYKTADGTRKVHFAGTQEIPINVPVQIETDANDRILSFQVAEGQQTPASAPEAVSAAPVAPQTPSGSQGGGPSERDSQIHRQTATKVAAQLLQYFPKEEQDLSTFYTVTEQLVSFYQTGDSVPF